MSVGLREYLRRLMEMIERVRTMQITSQAQLFVFAALLVFGLLNCVLGYRLLRFWVMLFGFIAGALGGYLVVRHLQVQEKIYYLGAMIGLGIIVAVVAFLIYKAGIFLLAAGLGVTASIYFLRPTSSALFFLCLLIGAALGFLSVKFSKEVIISATSLMGGAIAGLSLCKIGSLPEIPYGLGMAAGFAVLGMLVQFVTNRTEEDDEDEEDEEEEEPAKRNHSADSVDFRLPGRYDDTDDAFDEDVFDVQETNSRRSRVKKAPDLYDLKNGRRDRM